MKLLQNLKTDKMEQETLGKLYCKDCSKNLQKCTCMDDTVEMKQETSVEFLKKEYIKRGDCLPSGVFKDALEMEAKQNKNRYSEEEVCELIQFLSMNEEFNGYSSVSKETANYFLQQFKNK